VCPGWVGQVKIFRIGDDVPDGSLCSLDLAANDPDRDAVAGGDFRYLAAFYVPITRLHHLVGGREIGP
jgi:hypothetical protein